MKKQDINDTVKMKASFHPSLRLYATQLNGAGYSYTEFIANAQEIGLELEWSEHNLHKLFNFFSLNKYDKTSSKLTTLEFTKAWDEFQLYMAQASGITPEWLNDRPPMLGERKIK